MEPESESPAGSSRRPKRVGVVVLGMHRSGTSAAARLINLLGFSLGPEDNLMLGQENNPTGYWESTPLAVVNDEILAVLGGAWSAPPPVAEGWESRPELDALRTSAEELAASILADDQWVWKDPRNCLTLPFWRRLIGTEPAVVFIHRNPLEVAASLAVRDEMTIWFALALWERHVRSGLTAATGCPTYITTYEQLLRDPVEWSERVAQFLHERGAEVRAVQPDDVASFVQKELRHSEFEADALAREPAVSESQRALYAELRRLEGVHPRFVLPDLPPETPWAEALFEERRRAQRLERAAQVAEAARHQAQADLAGIQSSRSYRASAPLRAVAQFLESHRLG